MTAQPRSMPAFARAMMRLQAWLLRRNWLGRLGEEVMVITVTGRKTGRRYSTPIGFLRDGGTIVALSVDARGSQWYRNAPSRPQVELVIQGLPAAAPPAELERALATRVFMRFHPLA